MRPPMVPSLLSALRPIKHQLTHALALSLSRTPSIDALLLLADIDTQL